MANAVRSANISLNLARKYFWTCGLNHTVNGERLEYLWWVSAGIGGEPLRQQRAPGVVLRASRGSHNHGSKQGQARWSRWRWF